MTIDGVEVIRFADCDGMPIKNHLPIEIRDRMKTELQWLEEGFLVKPDATRYEMHASCMSKKTFIYYLDKDVEQITSENTPECCATCAIREGKYCAVAGDYVSSKYRCSEWMS